MAAAQTSGRVQPDECESGVHRAARPAFPVFERELPSVPGLELVPRRLLGDDEADLRWRLSDPAVASLFGSSGMGASLERAESYGYGALPCRRCGGRWRRKMRRNGEQVIIGWLDGTGREPKKHWGKRVTYAEALARWRADQCRKHHLVVISHHHEDPGVRELTIATFWDRGEQVVTPEELRDMFPTLPESETRPCQTCGGIGVVPRRSATAREVTVWPKGSSVRLGGSEGLSAEEFAEAIEVAAAAGDDGHSRVRDACASVSLRALERFVAVEQILVDVGRVAPIARIALEEYYREGGGMHELLGLTPAAAEHEAYRGSKWEARRQAQADELLDFAGQCWNLCAWGGAA
jgi:hypothetical protein